MRSYLWDIPEMEIGARVEQTLIHWRLVRDLREPYRCICGCPCHLTAPCHCGPHCQKLRGKGKAA